MGSLGFPDSGNALQEAYGMEFKGKVARIVWEHSQKRKCYLIIRLWVEGRNLMSSLDLMKGVGVTDAKQVPVPWKRLNGGAPRKSLLKSSWVTVTLGSHCVQGSELGAVAFVKHTEVAVCALQSESTNQGDSMYGWAQIWRGGGEARGRLRTQDAVRLRRTFRGCCCWECEGNWGRRFKGKEAEVSRGTGMGAERWVMAQGSCPKWGDVHLQCENRAFTLHAGAKN